MSLEPAKLGFLGVGTINSSIIIGVCNASPEAVKFPILMSPPRPNSAPRHGIPDQKALLARFGPEKVQIAESNAAVVKGADIVTLGVRPTQVEDLFDEVGKTLAAETDAHTVSVVSLVSTLKTHHLEAILKEQLPPSFRVGGIVKSWPQPAVQFLQGCTVGAAYKGGEHASSEDCQKLLQWWMEVGSSMGSSVPCTEEQLPGLMAATGMMGAMYQHLSWLSESTQISCDTPMDQMAAEAYLTAFFQGVLADAQHGGAQEGKSFQHFVEEQTAGGLNEQGIKAFSGRREETLQTLNAQLQRVL